METQIIHLDPSKIQTDSNVRFSLKPYRIERLKDEIIKDGGVHDPVEVQTLEGVKGYTHLLTVGHYRLAAILAANKEGAGLTLPAIVVEQPDAITRIRRQVSENRERENMSPMDDAIAIKQLMDQGVPKAEIRNIFAMAGGKKGLKVSPVSNSFVNIRLSFLDFPKRIQDLIHEGKLGTGAAWELTRHPRDKWDAILERAEAARLAEIEKEEKAEETLLKEEKSLTEKTQTAEVKETEAKTAAELAAETAKAVEAKSEAAAAAFKAKNATGLAAEERKKRDEAFKAAEAELKQARATLEEVTKKEEKAKEQAAKAKEAAEKAKAKIEEARAAKKAKKDAAAPAAKITGKAVKKGAKAAGSKTEAVKLNASEIRDMIHTLTLPGTPMNIAKVFAVVEKGMNGELTTKQVVGGVIKHFETLGVDLKKRVGMEDAKS